MIHFEWPLALLLLPLPFIFRALLPEANTNSSAALKVPFFSQLTPLGSLTGLAQHQQNPKLYVLLVIWLLLVISCTQPTWVGEPVQLPTNGRDLMLAVDVSPSMEEKDLKLNGNNVDRLTVLKHVMSDFIARREGDRLGLIIFGSQAYLQAPLTLDRITLNVLLDEAQTGIAGRATAIGDAIGLALKRLLQKPQEKKVLVLITDGENTAGEITPIKAAELAAAQNLTIYTIGIGADSMVVPGFFSSRKVNPSKNLDEDMLKKVASLTNGQYFRARTSQDLNKIYAILDKLEPVEGEQELYRPKKTLYHWPLGIAWVLGLLTAFSHLGGLKNWFHRSAENNDVAKASEGKIQ
ncbi:MAG: BatB protein [Gammaproteobacteria bacterium]|nr:MAG: BatB protein [Gammaproteobacteria bacterium]